MCFLGAVIRGPCALARHWPAKRDRFLSLAHVASKVLPTLKGCDRPKRDPPVETLREGKKLIAERITVKLPVGCRDDAGFVDCLFEERCERSRSGCCHVVLLPALRARANGPAAIMAGAVSQSRVGCRLGAFACYQHAGVPLLLTTTVVAVYLQAEVTPGIYATTSCANRCHRSR